MASVKITNYMREKIRDAAVTAGFAERTEKLAIAEDQIARKVYSYLMDAKVVAIAETLPAEWVARTTAIRVNAGGYNATLQMLEQRVVPYGTSYRYDRLGDIKHGPLCDEIQTHVNLVKDLTAEKEKAKRATYQMLSGISTIGKLEEVWPEGAAFYAEYKTAPPVQLPAIRTDEVNAMLGLPKP